MAKKRQPITQEKDRDDGQKKATNNTRKGPWQWPRKGNQEHKRRITMMAKEKQSRTQKDDHNHGNG